MSESDFELAWKLLDFCPLCYPDNSMATQYAASRRVKKMIKNVLVDRVPQTKVHDRDNAPSNEYYVGKKRLKQLVDDTYHQLFVTVGSDPYYWDTR